MRKADLEKAIHTHVRVNALEDALRGEDQADGDPDENNRRGLRAQSREKGLADGIHTSSAARRRALVHELDVGSVRDDACLVAH
ncbi:MAG: hypothetical protein ACLP2H_16095, partial [Terriglobales bacterium]